MNPDPSMSNDNVAMSIFKLMVVRTKDDRIRMVLTFLCLYLGSKSSVTTWLPSIKFCQILNRPPKVKFLQIWSHWAPQYMFEISSFCGYTRNDKTILDPSLGIRSINLDKISVLIFLALKFNKSIDWPKCFSTESARFHRPKHKLKRSLTNRSSPLDHLPQWNCLIHWNWWENAWRIVYNLHGQNLV